MPHYKDLNNKPHFLDDASFVHLLPGGCVEITPEEAAALVAPPAPTLEELKELKRTEIRTAHELHAALPVTVSTVVYHGGFDSAIKLDAAKRLAETAGLLDVTFYDTTNVGHVLSFVDATTVILTVAGTYQVSLARKQTAMVQVEEALDEAALALVAF